MRLPLFPLLAALLLTLPLAACKPAAKTNPQQVSADRATTANLATNDNTSALELYNAHCYAEARAKAENDMLTMKGRDREVAQLTAGLSAHALNQSGLAQMHLEPLTGSADPQIAGRAEAVLGQIAEKKGNHAYAADLFKRAAQHLDGDDAARAAVRAGNSLTSLNKPAEAARQYQQAAKEADSEQIKRTAAKLGKPGTYTIQVAAFHSRASADKRAKEMAPTAARAGFGSPRVVPDTVGGKPGYAVHIGSFPSRPAAVAAKNKLGNSQFMVVSAN